MPPKNQRKSKLTHKESDSDSEDSSKPGSSSHSSVHRGSKSPSHPRSRSRSPPSTSATTSEPKSKPHHKPREEKKAAQPSVTHHPESAHHRQESNSVVLPTTHLPLQSDYAKQLAESKKEIEELKKVLREFKEKMAKCEAGLGEAKKKIREQDDTISELKKGTADREDAKKSYASEKGNIKRLEAALHEKNEVIQQLRKELCDFADGKTSSELLIQSSISAIYDASAIILKITKEDTLNSGDIKRASENAKRALALLGKQKNLKAKEHIFANSASKAWEEIDIEMENSAISSSVKRGIAAPGPSGHTSTRNPDSESSKSVAKTSPSSSKRSNGRGTEEKKADGKERCAACGEQGHLYKGKCEQGHMFHKRCARDGDWKCPRCPEGKNYTGNFDE